MRAKLKHLRSAAPWVSRLVAVTTVLVGCKWSDAEMATFVGHYAGSLTTRIDGTLAQIPVQLDVTTQSWANLEVKDEKGATLMTVNITNVTPKSLQVQSSLGMDKPLTLTVDQDCFRNKQDLEISICREDINLNFTIHDTKANIDIVDLEIHKFSLPKLSDEIETPKDFTLSEAIARARDSSYQTKDEYERVRQAKLGAQAAERLKLPKISMSTIAGNLATNPLKFAPTFPTLLAAIGDLAPFMLPSRWYAANAAGHMKNVEIDIMRLLKLDMGLQIEGLAYAYARDKASLQLTKDLIAKELTIADEVAQRTDLGQFRKESTAQALDAVSQANSAQTNFEYLVAADLAALSAALGYQNPLTVKGMVIDREDVPIEDALKKTPYTNDDIYGPALAASLERDEMKEVVKAIINNEKGAHFAWLDPQADPSLALGPALPAEIDIIKSQKDQAVNTLNFIMQQIRQKSLSAALNYQTALKEYAEAQHDLDLQIEQLNIKINDLAPGKSLDLLGLIVVYQNVWNEQLTLESCKANFRVARAQIDRLLLQGYYTHFN